MVRDDDERSGAIPDEDRKKLLETLNRIAPQPCPRCATHNFVLIDSYTAIPIALGAARTGAGDEMPCVLLVCTYCGFVALHASAVVEEDVYRVRGGHS
jgi:hypothetical protein